MSLSPPELKRVASGAEELARHLGKDVLGIVAANSVAFVEAVFEAQKAGIACVILRSAEDTERLELVTRVVEPEARTGWARLDFKPSDADRICQVVYSSGTTGQAKAIALTERNIADAASRLIAAMGLDSSVREYVGVPVYYSFGLGRCRAVSAAGGSFYVPPRGFDPSEIAALLRAGEINAISAVPTLWRIVLQNQQVIGELGAKVKWIEIGSQAMSRSEKEALKRLFPNAAIVQHYGLTEASRTTFLRIHEEHGKALASVGRPEGEVEVRLDASGQIQTRGPHVAPVQILGGKLALLTDEDGWLSTGDLGRIEDGLVYFEGRIDDMINCAGVKLSPEALDERLRAELGVEGGVAVARLADPMRGEAILAAFEPQAGLDAEKVRAAAVKAAESLGMQAAGAIRVQAVDAIPLTETGKVRRKALAELATPERELTPVEARLVALWKEALDAPVVGPDDTFFGLGGDELAAGELIARMEAEGIPPEAARRLFDGASLGEIARAGEAPPAASDGAAHEPIEHRILGIWREALGRDDVGLNESFYDVGGDSISAVVVALGMEQAGFPPELAHGIFDGKTIAELCREIEAQQAGGGEDPAQKILAIWREALGRDDVGLHESFYDVGGDSISAVVVALGMEQAGFSPELAHGIFDGKTIAELAGETAPVPAQPAGEPSAAAPGAAPSGKTEVAVYAEASNFIKGVVFLCMIASHWVPTYLWALHLGDTIVRPALAPIFSLGSPTLAVAFGMGVSVFYLRQYEKSRASFRKNVRMGSILLGVGAAVYAGVSLLSAAVLGAKPDLYDVLGAIPESPFVYYLIATASLPLWLGRLKRDGRTALGLLGASLAAYGLYLAARAVVPEAPAREIAWATGVLVGHWSLFQMASISLLGAAIGLMVETGLQDGRGSGKALKPWLAYGLLSLGFAIVASVAAKDWLSWFTFPKMITLWGVLGYAGLAMAIIGAFQGLSAGARRWRPARFALELTCCLGVLLFPLFVLQSLVFESSEIVRRLAGLSPVMALSACIAAAAAVAVYPVWRVYRLYYAGRR